MISQKVGESTKPLIRQIATLQRLSDERNISATAVERSLLERCNKAEKNNRELQRRNKVLEDANT